MSLLVGVARVGAGVGVVLGAAVLLSACTGQASSSGAAPGATTSTASTTSTATSPATTAPVGGTVSATPGTQPGVCASATKSVLLAAVKANRPLADALVIDGKGLQDIKCAASVNMALAHFSNDIDGGSVLFAYQHGSWVATTGGTDVCSDLPEATQKQICD
jgi:hypothetical protein